MFFPTNGPVGTLVVNPTAVQLAALVPGNWVGFDGDHGHSVGIIVINVNVPTATVFLVNTENELIVVPYGRVLRMWS